ncbi:MAG: hypothetical protein V1906_00905 [Candidatus Woesearchaeota archaeon]
MATKVANGNNNHMDSVTEDKERRLAHSLALLDKLKGCSKPRRRISKEERDRMAMELTPEDGERLAKEFGLTL